MYENNFSFENDQEIVLDPVSDSTNLNGEKKNRKKSSKTTTTTTTTTTTQGDTYDDNKKKKKEDKYSDKGLTKAQKCELYSPKFTQSRFWQVTIVSTLLCGAIAFGYQLKWPFILLIMLAGFFLTQSALVAICRNIFEAKKIEDAASYIEQMLYSFRRNSKILASLQDTVSIFEDGMMKDTINEAIDYIITASTVGNVYEEALALIQARYDSRRIRSLHRFLVKVEGVGGDHTIGIQALINDRRMWLERVDDYKKEKMNVLLEIIVASAFSSAICAITMYMLPQDVGAAKHIISQVGSTLFILVALFTVSKTFQNTVLMLNDTYTKEEEMYMLKKFRWFKTWDKKMETKKGLKPAIMMIALGIVAVFLNTKYWWVLLLFGAMAAFSYFVQPITKYNSTRKRITREIEKVYPDWLLELSLLLQTENLHVALEKTLDTAPMILQDDLIQLGEDIASYPTEVFPYTNFIHDINVPNIHSSMKLLYSIATYGSDEEEKQIAELVERNAFLMNKAEQVKNQEKLAKVYIFKFIPMASSALKLICDMACFLILFIGQSLTAL